MLLRVVLLASAGIIGSLWAIHRYYFHPRAPMLVPVPSASEIPAPELVPLSGDIGEPGPRDPDHAVK